MQHAIVYMQNLNATQNDVKYIRHEEQGIMQVQQYKNDIITVIINCKFYLSTAPLTGNAFWLGHRRIKYRGTIPYMIILWEKNFAIYTSKHKKNYLTWQDKVSFSGGNFTKIVFTGGIELCIHAFRASNVSSIKLVNSASFRCSCCSRRTLFVVTALKSSSK